MCGLVSVIQKNCDMFVTYSASRIFKQMLFADALRGTDGTGIFYKDLKKKQVFYNKVPGPSWEAIPKMKELDSIAGNVSFIIGHNRKATMGVHTYENTHPFHEGNIVLVHNGTLTNHKDLEKEVGHCLVDSQAIAKLLNQDKPKQALEKLEGAYALIWYNAKDEKLFFARNKERPLWMVETDQFIFLVSEPGLAHWIIERNDGVVTKTTAVKEGKIHSLFKNKAGKMQTQVQNFTPKEPAKYFSSQTYNYTNNYTTITTPASNTTQLPLYSSKDEVYAELSKWFRPGDSVLFTVTSSYKYGGKTIIKGTTVDKPAVSVEVEQENFNVFKGEMLEVLVSGIKMMYGSWRIFGVNPAKVDTTYDSANGTVLTDRILNQLDTKTCIACSAKPTNDMEEAYIYYNPNCKEHEFLCADCFEEKEESTVNYGTV